MKRWLLAGLVLVAHNSFADDYSEARVLAQQAQAAAFSGLYQLNGNESAYLNDFTKNPKESGLNQNTLKEEGAREASRNEAGQEIISKEQTRERSSVDLNSPEMRDAGNSIDGADGHVSEANIPCTDGRCLPVADDLGNDIGEGASRLGVLVGAAKEVADKQIGERKAAIFAGKNLQCRIAALHIGNCCGKRARFLNCREEEKALGTAIHEERAFYVGKYCAERKMGACIEEKESWCVFPTLLASIIQIQGRFQQLGINFGWTDKRNNAANCRGIKPKELEHIDFAILNLGSLTKEFESRHLPNNPEAEAAGAASKIGRMEQGGRARG